MLSLKLNFDYYSNRKLPTGWRWIQTYRPKLMQSRWWWYVISGLFTIVMPEDTKWELTETLTIILWRNGSCKTEHKMKTCYEWFAVNVCSFLLRNTIVPGLSPLAGGILFITNTTTCLQYCYIIFLSNSKVSATSVPPARRKQ